MPGFTHGASVNCKVVVIVEAPSMLNKCMRHIPDADGHLEQALGLPSQLRVDRQRGLKEVHDCGAGGWCSQP